MQGQYQGEVLPNLMVQLQILRTASLAHGPDGWELITPRGWADQKTDTVVLLRRRGLIAVWNRQDHVRPQQELQVDLTTFPTIHSPAVGNLARGTAPTLLTPPIQDDLDILVFSETIQQILVQADLVVRDEKEMSGHALLHYPIGERVKLAFSCTQRGARI